MFARSYSFVKFVLILIVVLLPFSSFAQFKGSKLGVTSISSVSTEKEIPFWLQSNKNGIIQNNNSQLVKLDFVKGFSNESLFDYSYGFNLIGALGEKNEAYFNEYFAKLKFQKMQLSIGAERPIERFDGLSATNGSIIFSGNASPIPMLTGRLTDFVDVPFTRGYLSFKGSISHGWMSNERYVQDTYLHHKNLYIKLGKDEGFSLTAGVEHYAFWAGNSPKWGSLQSGLKAYKEVFFVDSGDPIVASDGTVSENESIWKLGDHKGQNSLELSYSNEFIKTVVYGKSIYEDSSNSNFFKNKDLNVGFYIHFKRCKLLSSFMYEHFSTIDQSGIRPQPHKELVEKSPYLGTDYNFNHSIYNSGWTNKGRVIGMPLMLASPVSSDGITHGVANSAIKAHHFGFKGEAPYFKYKFFYTYSLNYGNTGLGKKDGKYFQSYTYEDPLKQQSLYLDLQIQQSVLPMNISFALGYDFGDLLPDNNFGFQLKLSKFFSL